MLKKTKQEAFKALKGLAQSKNVRSKYEFSFTVDSIDGLVAVESNKEVSIYYRVRGCNIEGSLPKKVVPMNKTITWQSTFNVEAKFTHTSNKVNSDKILRIDVLVKKYNSFIYHIVKTNFI